MTLADRSEARDPRAEYLAVATEVAALATSDEERRPVIRRDEVPASADVMTVQWLSAVLCDGVPDARVESFALEGATSTHTQRRAISLRYNAAGVEARLPDRLFSKSTPLGGRAMLRISGGTANEIGFCNHIHPETPLEAPHAYYAGYEGRSMRSMILMEDAGARGVRFLNVSHEMTLDMVRGVLGQLAILHARWWQDSRLDTEFDWLKSSSAFSLDLQDVLDYERISLLGVDAAADVLPPALVRERATLWQALEQSLRLGDRAPNTFLHGDIHPGNTYQLPGGGMGLCDWQCTVKGTWARDFAYVMTSFVPAEIRRATERDLLGWYLKRLHRLGAPEQDFDEAWRLYRTQTLHSFFAWAFTLGMALTQIEMQPPHVCREILRRKGAAIDELATLAALAEAQ